MKKPNLSDYNYCVTVGQTDVGRRRQANEDHGAHFVTQNGLVSVVCDGMGGHVGGAVASKVAVEAIHTFLDTHYFDDPRQAIGQAIDAANQAILARAAAEPDLTGMGSTCVLLIVRDAKVYIGHVGDSRIYIVREKNITQLTKDHSYVQMLVDMGEISKEEAERHPRKNEITNALGILHMSPATVKAEPITPQAGDCFVLCSDGLSGMVSERYIERTVSKQRELRTQERADRLVQMANENGGVDNITVELVEFTITPDAVTMVDKAKRIGLAAAAVIAIAAVALGVYRLLSPEPGTMANTDWGTVAFAENKPVFTLKCARDGTTVISFGDDAETKTDTIGHAIEGQEQIRTNLSISKPSLDGYALSLPHEYPAGTDTVYVCLSFGKDQYTYYAKLEGPSDETGVITLQPYTLSPVPYEKGIKKTIATLTFYPVRGYVVLSVTNNDPIELEGVRLDTGSIHVMNAEVEYNGTDSGKQEWRIKRTRKGDVVLSFTYYDSKSGKKWTYVIPAEVPKVNTPALPFSSGRIDGSNINPFLIDSERNDSIGDDGAGAIVPSTGEKETPVPNGDKLDESDSIEVEMPAVPGDGSDDESQTPPKT